MIADLYPEYINNAYNSIIKRKQVNTEIGKSLKHIFSQKRTYK